MTNDQIIECLSHMLDGFAAMLDKPLFEGALPLIRATVVDTPNGERITLILGVEAPGTRQGGTSDDVD